MVREIVRGSCFALAAGFAGATLLGAAGCGEVSANPDAGDSSREDGGSGNGGEDDGGESGDPDASADPDARADCDDGFTGADCDECTVFVDGEDGDDGESGLSWDDAVASVGAGIERAGTRIGNEDLDRCSVWVREGTYVPGEDREDAFELAPDVHVYGGFAGFEAARDERNVEEYETVLSGDLEQDDDADDENTLDDNAYHVVLGTDDATLDGFTITAGNANGSAEDEDGAGIYNADASPALENLVVTENQAESDGGGMINLGDSAPTLSNVSFTENQAEHGGGAMYNDDTSAPRISNVSFTENRAEENGGGAMYNFGESAPTLTNVSFTANRAPGTSTAGGGMVNFRDSAPTLTNVSFTENQADFGGAMYSRDTSAPTLTNVSFAENQAEGDGGAIGTFDSAEVEIYNAILWGTSDEIDHTSDEDLVIRSSIVEGGEAGITGDGAVDAASDDIRDEDPKFVDAPDDLRLQEGSPAIDEGEESVYDDLGIDLPDTDLGGDPRLVDGEDGGEGPLDLGAFEFQTE